jgi:superfamily II DNA or RNA helicase
LVSSLLADFAMIALSERLLADAGGWQTMKQARTLHEMGRVMEALYDPPLLQGRVREGETEYRAGLRILSKSNIENLCRCRQSQQHGAICAHSLALGLEVLRPRAAAPPPRPVSEAPAQIVESIFSSDATGPLATLFIVLAPNLVATWEKDAVVVGAEALVNGRRTLLSALDRSLRYRCEPADTPVFEKLQAMTGGNLPGMMMLGRDAASSLFAALIGHPRVTLGRDRPIAVRGDAIRPALKIERMASGALDLIARPPVGLQPLLSTSAAWAFGENELVPLSPGLPAMYLEMLRRNVHIAADRAELFLARELPLLRQFMTVEADGITASDDFSVGANVPAPRFALKLEGSLNFLSAELQAVRGDQHVTLGAPGRPVAHPAEIAALERLRAAGFVATGGGKLELRGEPAIVRFFARDLPRLEQEWKVTVGERFAHVTRDVQRVRPQLEIRSSGENWFELEVELATPDGDRFAASEIQRLIQSGRNSVRLRSGKTAIFDSGLLDELQQVLTDCEPEQRQPGVYRIDRRHAPYVEAIAADNAMALSGPAGWNRDGGAGTELGQIKPIPLGTLEKALRPYQKHGVYWLNFLAINNLAGILADEMGLGKTVQALAFLRHLGGLSLVICPASLVENWRREAARFVPELKCLAIHGPERDVLFSSISGANLVITSYPLLRRDAHRYRDIHFAAMVLDEAQHIKNPESQNAQSASSIHARHRFVLTGTPIENSLRDIWSLMHFLMPGYLGTRVVFKERFEEPIRRDAAGPEQRRLMARLRPFILRRSKAVVATELPQKIEQVSYCELTTNQRSVYNELLGATRRQLFDTAGAKDRNKNRMLILTALLRLRQTCCDLRLLDLPNPELKEPSGKLELLTELLEEVVDGGHRVIIFSQFVSMLQLLRAHLDESGVSYAYLDGSTKDRQDAVDAFQAGDAPAFLMSLKAGGVGLNITAADTVVHFDPWWNPAVEAQATDRAHRIGQTKVVTAYKLIARDTIEEKILTLQTRKRDLVAATIESEQPLMEGLSMHDLESLLE